MVLTSSSFLLYDRISILKKLELNLKQIFMPIYMKVNIYREMAQSDDQQRIIFEGLKNVKGLTNICFNFGFRNPEYTKKFLDTIISSRTESVSFKASSFQILSCATLI